MHPWRCEGPTDSHHTCQDSAESTTFVKIAGVKVARGKKLKEQPELVWRKGGVPCQSTQLWHYRQLNPIHASIPMVHTCWYQEVKGYIQNPHAWEEDECSKSINDRCLDIPLLLEASKASLEWSPEPDNKLEAVMELDKKVRYNEQNRRISWYSVIKCQRL